MLSSPNKPSGIEQFRFGYLKCKEEDYDSQCNLIHYSFLIHNIYNSFLSNSMTKAFYLLNDFTTFILQLFTTACNKFCYLHQYVLIIQEEKETTLRTGTERGWIGPMIGIGERGIEIGIETGIGEEDLIAETDTTGNVGYCSVLLLYVYVLLKYTYKR